MNSVWTATTLGNCATNTSATRGDICIASTDSKSYILSTTTPSNQSDWQELLNPAAPVSQVNGQVGNINFIGTNGVSVSGTTISLTNVGSGGIYGSATSIPVITTDAQGRVTGVTVTTIPTATASTLGLLSPTDYIRFSGKQDLIATGALSQYYRGDKTWASLDTSVVTESGATNLYFTATRARSALSITGSLLTYNAGTGLFGTNLSALSGSYWALGGNSVSAIQNIGTTSNFDLPFITNNVERMRLTANGNLGIGTSVPMYKLDISSAALSNGVYNPLIKIGRSGDEVFGGSIGSRTL